MRIVAKLAVVFWGTSSFGIPTLRDLLDSELCEIKLVVTQPDREQGRSLKLSPTPVAQFIEAFNATCPPIALLKPENTNSDEVVNQIEQLMPDLLITASYGGLIGRRLRKLPALGAINIHPSLLPQYRGASPIQTALLQGETRTGISIFRLNAKMDAGDILYQHEADIYPHENYSMLHDRLAELSAAYFMDFLGLLIEGRIDPIPQDHSQATFSKKIEKEDLIINWSRPAQEIYNKIRALSESPGAYTEYQGQKIKILKTELSTEQSNGKPGTVASLSKNVGININTADQQLLITQLQASGKKVMSAWAWQLGARTIAGDRFGR